MLFSDKACLFPPVAAHATHFGFNSFQLCYLISTACGHTHEKGIWKLNTLFPG